MILWSDDAPELAPHPGGLGAAAHRLWRASWPEGPTPWRGLRAEDETPTLTVPAVSAYKAFRSTPTPRSCPSARPVGAPDPHTARGAVSLERLTQDANGDLLYTFTHPWSDGTTGIRLSPLELLEKLAALCRCRASTWYAMGAVWRCIATRGAIIPPRQQGVEEQEHRTASPRWNWTRLLKRIFALEMARCPRCQWGRCGSLPPSRTAR